MTASTIKVLHLGGCPLPAEVSANDPVRRGRHPGRWVLDLCMAQNQSDSGLQPTLATVVRRLSRSIDTSMDGIPINYIASRTRARLLRGYRTDRRELVNLANRINPDIIHAHGFEDSYALAAQDAKRPYVITAQGLMFKIIPALNPPLRSWLRIIRIYEHIALKKAKHVIVKSDTVAQALNSRYPHLELYRIPNTFDPRLLEIKEPCEANTLVFVGTVIPNKGIHLLGKALRTVIRSVPGVNLFIVGDLQGKGQLYEQQEIGVLRDILGDRLHTFGRVPGNRVGQIVARAKAIVAPTKWEMFGNQLIEALLVGTHGIVSEGTGLAENARRFGNATVVPQQDPQALADAIVSVLHRNDFPEREQARKRIIDYMGPEAVAKMHLDVYHEVLDAYRKRNNE